MKQADVNKLSQYQRAKLITQLLKVDKTTTFKIYREGRFENFEIPSKDVEVHCGQVSTYIEFQPKK